jgi:hypothetical protein
MRELSQQQKPSNLSFLGWCLLLATLANICSAGTLVYLAQRTFNVRVTEGTVIAYVRPNPTDREPIPIKITDVDIRAPALEVRGKVSVDGEVSMKPAPSPYRRQP